NLKGDVSPAALDECIRTLITLNRTASEVLQEFHPHAVTDVTGFGLAGHAMEMAHGSGVTIRIDTQSVPLMREALAMYERGVKTGANLGNRNMVSERTRFTRNGPPWQREIWFDPQTSGGLLIAVPNEESAPLLDNLVAAGVIDARRIGSVEPFDGRHNLVFD
ncbi:MAG TPA: AIR synthase-related protein, partial [Thermoanaerobaculia bacterium]|nr:AIR synthase-related protein [Thermoanaerobaculia bacterium]